MKNKKHDIFILRTFPQRQDRRENFFHIPISSKFPFVLLENDETLSLRLLQLIYMYPRKVIATKFHFPSSFVIVLTWHKEQRKKFEEKKGRRKGGYEE